MKKLILIIFCMLLVSCGRDVVEFGNEENVFIVNKIETISGDRSLYYSHWTNGGVIAGAFTEKDICLIMPSNLFIVGDTIDIDFIKIKRKLIRKGVLNNGK